MPGFPQSPLVPTITLEVAFVSNPGDAAYTWTDLSSRLRSFTIRRGRNDELGSIDSGVARVRLDNSDRALEPEYAAGAYYPNVDVLRPVRISAVWAATTYRLYTGYVERWAPTVRSPKGAYVDLDLVDGFELLKQASLEGISLGGVVSGAAIAGALNAAAWPAALRAIDTGRSPIAASVGGASDEALGFIQAVADSEIGYAFMSGAGAFTFHDRWHRLVSPANVSRFTFGSNVAGGEIPFLTATPSFDKSEIANDWTISDQASNSATFQDSTSIGRYLIRSRARSVLLSNPSELAYQAQFLTGRYKAPHRTFRELTLRGDRVTFAALLALELGDRVTVVDRPPGGGGSVTKQGNVESIEITQGNGTKWAGTLRLSPADQQTYWIAGTSHAGVDTVGVY